MDADPDPSYNLDADPDAHPDPAYHFDADPDPPTLLPKRGLCQTREKQDIIE